MAVDVVVDEVADNLEELAAVTRRINTKSVGLFVGGAAVGLAIGIVVGYKLNKEKIKAEAFKQSEQEVARIRELYQQKEMARQEKPSVAEIVEKKGYGLEIKMPVEEVDEVVMIRPLPAPVPGIVEPIPGTATPAWDYRRELRHREELDEGEPYVIHQEEFMGKEKGYSQVTYTYYAIDDVLVDEENDHPLPHADIVVGLDNLQFGHGTDDDNVVFVRNDKLEIDMEICRLNKSFEEEVLGIDPHDTDTPTDD